MGDPLQIALQTIIVVGLLEELIELFAMVVELARERGVLMLLVLLLLRLLVGVEWVLLLMRLLVGMVVVVVWE